MARTVSAVGENLIKSEEALRLAAYTCPAGVLTIGYGHTGPDVYEGEQITAGEAEAILRRDIGRFEACVDRVCPKAVQEQFDAMVSLAFNIGEAAFARSSVARLHNAEQYAEAGQAFALWNKGGGKVLPGLVRRRAAEAALYMSIARETAPAATAEGEKPLAASRALTGQAVAASAATVGTVYDQFDDFKRMLWELSPYFSAVKWALLALVVAGVLYAVYARVSDRHTGRA